MYSFEPARDPLLHVRGGVEDGTFELSAIGQLAQSFVTRILEYQLIFQENKYNHKLQTCRPRHFPYLSI